MTSGRCEWCGKEFLSYPSAHRRFCSRSCATKKQNARLGNPAKRADVRAKISAHHADISGKNNPMYGKRGKDAPSYIDGRSSFEVVTYIGVLLASGRERKCELCGSSEKVHVHHKDGNHKNNNLSNLMFVCPRCHNLKCHKYFRDKRGRYVGSVVL